jgi:hypothetical protein
MKFKQLTVQPIVLELPSGNEKECQKPGSGQGSKETKDTKQASSELLKKQEGAKRQKEGRGVLARGVGDQRDPQQASRKRGGDREGGEAFMAGTEGTGGAEGAEGAEGRAKRTRVAAAVPEAVELGGTTAGKEAGKEMGEGTMGEGTMVEGAKERGERDVGKRKREEEGGGRKEGGGQTEDAKGHERSGNSGGGGKGRGQSDGKGSSKGGSKGSSKGGSNGGSKGSSRGGKGGRQKRQKYARPVRIGAPDLTAICYICQVMRP